MSNLFEVLLGHEALVGLAAALGGDVVPHRSVKIDKASVALYFGALGEDFYDLLRGSGSGSEIDERSGYFVDTGEVRGRCPRYRGTATSASSLRPQISF